MAYKIKTKQKKERMEFSENGEYYLIDVKKNIYDPHLIKGWNKAVHLNLVYQVASDNPNVVPMPKKWVLKNKLKQGKLG